MNRLDTLEKLLTHSDDEYWSLVFHDDLAALVAVARAVRAFEGFPWITQFRQDIEDALAPLLKEVPEPAPRMVDCCGLGYLPATIEDAVMEVTE